MQRRPLAFSIWHVIVPSGETMIMVKIRTTAMAGLVALAMASGVLVEAPMAGATVDVVVDATVLRVYLAGAAGESVTVECSAGSVKVNDTATALSCAAATSIQVNGGDGPDTIDLSNVTGADFTHVTQVSASGGAGADDITASPLGTNMFGDAGSDTMTGDDGPDYFQSYGGKDTMVGNGGPDVIFSDTGSTIDAGEGDDIIYSIWPAGRPASIDGGTGTDEFRHSASQLEDKLLVHRRTDGDLDLVDTMPTASDVITVPASFEKLAISTVQGNDLVWVNGLSAVTEISVQGGSGSPRLEVFGKGPVTKSAVDVTRAGFAPVTYTGMTEVLAFGALSSANHAFVHAATHDLGGSHLATSQVSAIAAKITGGTLSRTAYATQLVGSLSLIIRKYMTYLVFGSTRLIIISRIS